jgi:hypothetical protein
LRVDDWNDAELIVSSARNLSQRKESVVKTSEYDIPRDDYKMNLHLVGVEGRDIGRGVILESVRRSHTGDDRIDFAHFKGYFSVRREHYRIETNKAALPAALKKFKITVVELQIGRGHQPDGVAWNDNR